MNVTLFRTPTQNCDIVSHPGCGGANLSRLVSFCGEQGRETRDERHEAPAPSSINCGGGAILSRLVSRVSCPSAVSKGVRHETRDMKHQLHPRSTAAAGRSFRDSCLASRVLCGKRGREAPKKHRVRVFKRAHDAATLLHFDLDVEEPVRRLDGAAPHAAEFRLALDRVGALRLVLGRREGTV